MENKKKHFYDLYELTTDIDAVKKYSKDIKDKTCRLCNKSFPETTFKTVPHIIPQLFGRNTYTSNIECDNCNNSFARNETDLATFISPFTTLLKMRTKKGVPIFKSRTDNRTKKATTA